MTYRGKLELGKSTDGKKVVLPREDRKLHTHIIGAPRRGKSRLMEHMIRTDISNGDGLLLLDPHGELYDRVVAWCVAEGMFRKRDIFLFEPASEDWTFGLNPLDLRGVSSTHHDDIVAGAVRAICQARGGENIDETPRIARILKRVFQVVAEKSGTLREAVDLCDPLDPDGLRRHLTTGIENEILQREWDFWNTLSPTRFGELFEGPRNRIEKLVTHRLIESMVSQTDHVIDFTDVLKKGTIVLANLQGLPQENIKLLGSLMVNDIFEKAKLRGLKPTPDPYFLYLDEAYYFLGDDVRHLLVETPKFGLWATLAHHDLGQLREAGNAVYTAVTMIENKIVFGGRHPIDDAREIAHGLYLGYIDYEEPKHAFDKPVVTGFVREWLRQKSQSSGSSSSGASGSSSGSSATGDVFTQMSGLTEISGSMSIDSAAEGLSEALIPVLEVMPTQGYSLDEQIDRLMAKIVNQLPRQANVKLFGQPPVEITTTFVDDPLASDGYVEKIKLQAYQETPFALQAPEAKAQVEARRAQLKAAARTPTDDEPTTFSQRSAVPRASKKPRSKRSKKTPPKV